MRLVVIPNKSLFNFSTPMYIFVSRNDTMKIIYTKVSKALSNYLYCVMKNKETMVRKLRIWKSSDNNLEAIWELDKKIKNYSEVKINAALLPDQDSDAIIFDDLNAMDEDLFVVELPKSENNFLFKA